VQEPVTTGPFIVYGDPIAPVIPGVAARKIAIRELIIPVEIILVFAVIGRTPGVIDDAIFSAIVLMVMATTLAAPPLMKTASNSQQRRAAAA